MKQNKTLIKELRRDLHYHQMMVRIDLRAVRAGVRKCKELGEQMRDLQSGKTIEHEIQRATSVVSPKETYPQPEVLPVSPTDAHQLPLI